MGKNTLHFLNGDSTKFFFDQTTIEGSVAVMRETFAFWPILSLDDPNFWSQRRKYFQQYYFVVEEEYNDRVLSELEKSKKPFEEIVIWYEFDTYCQINMMFLVEWISRHSKSIISLVYSSIGLGCEPPHIYPQLLKNKIQLSDKDIQGLRQLFNEVRSSQFDSIDWHGCPNLPNLRNSIEAFQRQFYPKKGQGMIQQRIIEFLKTGEKNGKKVIDHLMKTDTIYGFGDLQYLILLAGMETELEYIKPKSVGKAYFDELMSANFELKK